MAGKVDHFKSSSYDYLLKLLLIGDSGKYVIASSGKFVCLFVLFLVLICLRLSFRAK